MNAKKAKLLRRETKHHPINVAKYGLSKHSRTIYLDPNCTKGKYRAAKKAA